MSTIFSATLRGVGIFALATGALFSATPHSAMAEQIAYPDKPVRFIVGRPAGGVADIAARVLAQNLSNHWQQQVVVENRPGGNGLIATRAAAQAPADGYSLLVAPDSDFTINRFILKGWHSSLDDDLVAIARLTANPTVLVASISTPFNTIQELISAAKANPGKITFATAGVASTPHLIGEHFAERAGIELSHIPYKGGTGAAAAAAGGHTDLAVIAVSSAVPLVKAGKIKILGLSTKDRLESQPDWPTIAEGGLPDFEGNIWTGLFAQTSLPPDIIKKLRDDITKMLSLPSVQQQYENIGAQVAPLFGNELRAVIKNDTDHYGTLVKRLNLALN